MVMWQKWALNSTGHTQIFSIPQQVDFRTAESYCRDLENTLEMEREVYFYLRID